MREIALRAISELTEKHNPEFIVLYGSVVRGDFTADSDIDVACFCKEPEVSKDIRVFENKKLDCWVYSLEGAVPIKSEFLRFVGGEVFLDNHGIGKKFIRGITEFYEKGPNQLKPDEITHLVEWSRNMLIRAEGKSTEAKYRRTWLPCELLEIYFNLRNLWYLGSKQSFAWLEENDSAAYRLFDKAFSDPTDLLVLRELVSAVTNTEQVQAMDAKKPAPML
ncbi:nucleotidyltransferase family protein [Reinekea marinisedimentorum]|uniref:Nucleotidyltransferase-like protein n=1 Tax=Reinekea marinisedimentorum TaxID=230495 RepID=A0A4R3HQP7_9GAMM|nr:nucleotidyltransferase domain-containing protein [Reinekea marinisedimentorum]TCS35084.1 nucleotidyltransferase-like protein [Reinekea marinisedimentorum]